MTTGKTIHRLSCTFIFAIALISCLFFSGCQAPTIKIENNTETKIGVVFEVIDRDTLEITKSYQNILPPKKSYRYNYHDQSGFLRIVAPDGREIRKYASIGDTFTVYRNGNGNISVRQKFYPPRTLIMVGDIRDRFQLAFFFGYLLLVSTMFFVAVMSIFIITTLFDSIVLKKRYYLSIANNNYVRRIIFMLVYCVLMILILHSTPWIRTAIETRNASKYVAMQEELETINSESNKGQDKIDAAGK